jgi:hypothetical protein
MVNGSSGLRTSDFGLILSGLIPFELRTSDFGLATAAKQLAATNKTFNIFLPFQACEIKR